MLTRMWVGAGIIGLHIAAGLGVIEALNAPSTLAVFGAVVGILVAITADVLGYRFYRYIKGVKAGIKLREDNNATPES